MARSTFMVTDWSTPRFRRGSTQVFVVASLLIVASANSHASLSLEEASSVVANIQRHFKLGCILLLSKSSSYELRFVIRLQRYIAASLTPVNVVYLHDVDRRYRDFTQKCDNPLIVLPSSCTESRITLQRISRVQHMSAATWLHFQTPSVDAEVYYADIDVPFDCEFLVARRLDNKVLLTEIYRVRAHLQLLTFEFGWWTLRDGLHTTSLQIHDRRNNLHGIVLEAATIHTPPSVVLYRDGEKLAVGGILGDTYRVLEEDLNFKTRFRTPSDDHPGLANESYDWTMMVRLLQSKDVDISVGSFVQTMDRIDIIDYTTPVMMRKMSVFVRPTKVLLQWSSYLDPFSVAVWSTILFSVVVIGVCLAHMVRVDETGNVLHQLCHSGSMFCVIGLFLLQGHHVTPKGWPCRIVFLTAILTALIVVTSYSAILISFFAVQVQALPFQDLEGLLEDKKYEMGKYGLPFNFQLFEPRQRRLQQTVLQLMSRSRPPSSVLDGLSRVCTSKYALLTSTDDAAGLRANISCNVASLPGCMYKGTRSLGLPKHSPFRQLFNHRLLKLESGGVLAKLRSTAWEKQMTTATAKPVFRVGLGDVAPLLSLLALSSVVAVLVLAGEVWLHRRRGTMLVQARSRKTMPSRARSYFGVIIERSSKPR